MANVSEIEAQIEQTKLALKSLEAQLADEKGGRKETTKGPQRDEAGETEDAPSSEEASEMMDEGAGEEQSFADRVDERMAAPEKSPAEEVSEEDPAPMVDKVMVGIKVSKPDEGPEMDMDSLFQTVYDTPYDPESPMDADKMSQMKAALEDPRVKKMAMEEPEKFALFMYGKRSAQSFLDKL